MTVNGMTATTDDEGRYIVSGISRQQGDQLFVNTERAGYPATRPDSTGKTGTTPSSPRTRWTRRDFTLRGANNTVAITGVVTEAGTNAGIKGAEIKVDGSAPLNAGSNGEAPDGRRRHLHGGCRNASHLMTHSSRELPS